MIELIPEQGKFYKVNMHCHTNISDGKRSPEEVKEFYKKAGYSAVCFTDHEVLVPHKDIFAMIILLLFMAMRCQLKSI